MAKLSSREILWNEISRSVFQDRIVPYQKWLNAIVDVNHLEHHKITDQTLMMMPSATFVTLLGTKVFIENWINIREGAAKSNKMINDGVVNLDAMWSSIATGFAFTKPRASIKKPLPAKLKSTFLEVVKKSKSISIYDIKKNTGRAYNRVHADVDALNSLGLVTIDSAIIKNRTVKMVSVSSPKM